MTRRLTGYVLAEDPTGQRVLLSPSDPLPEWAHQTITNPKAWADDPESPAAPADEPQPSPAPPPGPEPDREPAASDVDQTDEPPETPPAAVTPDSPQGDQPDETWTNKEIKAYASAHGINLGQATTKADLLAKVRA